jgi:WD40 repeat protein
VWRPGEKPRKVRTGTRAHFRAVAYHPSGKYLLAANNDATVRVFDTDSWTVVKHYVWDIGHLTAVVVSPDGTLAAAGGRHGRVVVWDFDL